jgi:hypothetical protein
MCCILDYKEKPFSGYHPESQIELYSPILLTISNFYYTYNQPDDSNHLAGRRIRLFALSSTEYTME